MSTADTVELDLVELAAGGDAVGRHQGLVVFVTGGAPGERVEARIVERRRSFARAELVCCLSASEDRVAPRCELVGRCGGCSWQHVRDEAQLREKRRILAQALRKLELPEGWVFHPAPRPLGYRRRCRLRWRVDQRGVIVGFRGPRSRELVDVERCPALVSALDEGLRALRRALRRWGAGGGQGGGSAVLLADHEGANVHVSVRLDAGRGLSAYELLGAPLVGAVVQRRDGALERAGEPAVVLDDGLQASADAFAQANAAQDALLKRRVDQWVAELAPRRVLELFAGAGNLTSRLVAEGRRVEAVELSPASARWLRENAASWPGEVLIRERDAALALEEACAEPAPGLVVLDPPREGARALMPLLARLAPSAVLYVSCDPMTLGRDLALLRAAGYHLERLEGIDMMPQTCHVEVAALLSSPLSPPPPSR